MKCRNNSFILFSVKIAVRKESKFLIKNYMLNLPLFLGGSGELNFPIDVFVAILFKEMSRDIKACI